MPELVTLHTQALGGQDALTLLDALSRAVGAARLNAGFVDRRKVQHSFGALADGVRWGLYDRVFFDARSGLPNMASVTRARADAEVAPAALSKLLDEHELTARAGEAAIFEELARKRRYNESLLERDVAAVDEHRVLVRRHDPATGTAAFRIELSKLDASGPWIKVVIELSQTASVWRRPVIDLTRDGESAAASEALHALVYRQAAFDAETSFVRMHDIEGVTVERVHRTLIGPVAWRLVGADGVVRVPLELERLDATLGALWSSALPGAGELGPLELLASFQSDFAATDLAAERSNDPLVRLLADRIEPGERARYDALRARFPFRVFKDRKFVGTPAALALARELAAAAGTRNIMYPLG